MAVNATGCPPPTRMGPEREPVPWPVHLGSPRHDASLHETVAPEPQLEWRVDVGRAVRGSPAIGTDVIALGLAERSVLLLDRRTGERVWRTGVGGTVRAGPLLREDRVFVATEQTPEGRIYALRLRDGRRSWRVNAGDITAPLALDGDALYAATARGTVIRLRAADGTIEWSRRLPGAVRAAPVPTPAGVAIATASDTLFLLDAATGAVQHRHATPGPVFGTPVTDGTWLYYGTLRGAVRAVALDDLATIWEVTLPDAVYGAPALFRDTLAVLARDGTLALIPVGAPETHRTLPLGIAATAGPTVTRTGILIGSVAGDLLLVDRADGVVRWRDRVRGPIESPPHVRGGQVVVVGGRGEIQTYR